MRNINGMFWLISLLAVAATAEAGGRYANPPAGLVEVQQACAAGLEAAKKGDAAAALEQAKTGRKVALASYKELSTMPMEIGSSNMKKAIASLEGGNIQEAVPLFEHCKTKLDEEVDYYKKEGKL